MLGWIEGDEVLVVWLEGRSLVLVQVLRVFKVFEGWRLVLTELLLIHLVTSLDNLGFMGIRHWMRDHLGRLPTHISIWFNSFIRTLIGCLAGLLGFK